MPAAPMEECDAIIAGASFAGLLVARRLRGRVVLLDPLDVGEGQTSACGLSEHTARALRAEGAIQQVHHELVLHVVRDGGETVLRYSLPFPYCTFDYRTLCRELYEQAARRGAVLVRARARRVLVEGAGGRGRFRVPGSGFRVLGSGLSACNHPELQASDPEVLCVETDRGTFRARCVVDATGWRAVLASSVRPGFVDRTRLSGGLEVELAPGPAYRQEGLHFWIGSEVISPGYGWVFPCGTTARIGILRYRSAGGLKQPLLAFLRRLGLGGPEVESLPYHGGLLPSAPRPPTAGPVFVVGDAAGHCFGLTGEGIRPTMTYADTCGQLIQQALAGEIRPAAARRAYRRHVALRAPYFWLMSRLEAAVARMSDRGLARHSRWAQPQPMFRLLMASYLWAAPGRVMSEE